jgi:hypothetical protein
LRLSISERGVLCLDWDERFLRALTENIKIYEKNLGPIKESPEPPKFGIELSKN